VGTPAFLDFDDDDFSEPEQIAPRKEREETPPARPEPSPPPLPPVETAPPVMAPPPAVAHPAPTPPVAASPNQTTTPWVPAEEPAVAPSKLSLSTAVLITIATAVVVLAFGTWWVRRDSTVVEPVAPTAETSAPKAATPPPKPARRTRPKAAPKPVVDTRDGSDLPANQGYLTVKFPKNEGEVYFFTTSQGPVNKKLAVTCGTAFMRIGKSEPLGVRWLSEGKPVVVACQKVTEVSVEP
jgi:hypothetical protein